MAAAQIYSIVNTIANNIGYTGSTVVDTSSFVAFAQAALTGAKESVYNELYNLIGRTVFAIDEAEDEERGIVVDAFSYGSILQKISFQTQAAETSSEWDIANPENLKQLVELFPNQEVYIVAGSDVVANASVEYDISIVQIERKISKINDIIIIEV